MLLVVLVLVVQLPHCSGRGRRGLVSVELLVPAVGENLNDVLALNFVPYLVGVGMLVVIYGRGMW